MMQTDIDLPTKPKSSGKSFKNNIMMFLKPNKPKEFYRFRLIKDVQPGKSKRTSPFIERHIHDHWAMTEHGYKLPDDTVVCLKTDFVDFKGNRKKSCPMCIRADENFKIWQASGFKDPVSRDKFNAMKSKSQFIIPVFVVDDPNAVKDGKKFNNGRLKCFMFTDKEDYDKFMELVKTEITKAKVSAKNGKPYSIWNSKNAVDILIRMEEVDVKVHEGEPNEYTYKAKKITKMKFTSTPYDIEAITQESLDKFEFDEQYYVTNTVEEIEDFCNRHYSNDVPNVPDEDINIDDDDTEESTTVSLGNPAPKAADVDLDESCDDIIEDDDPISETSGDEDVDLDDDDLTSDSDDIDVENMDDVVDGLDD